MLKFSKGKKKKSLQNQLCPPPPPSSPPLQKAADSMQSLNNRLTLENNCLQQQQPLCLSKQSVTGLFYL